MQLFERSVKLHAKWADFLKRKPLCVALCQMDQVCKKKTKYHLQTCSSWAGLLKEKKIILLSKAKASAAYMQVKLKLWFIRHVAANFCLQLFARWNKTLYEMNGLTKSKNTTCICAQTKLIQQWKTHYLWPCTRWISLLTCYKTNRLIKGKENSHDLVPVSSTQQSELIKLRIQTFYSQQKMIKTKPNNLVESVIGLICVKKIHLLLNWGECWFCSN